VECCAGCRCSLAPSTMYLAILNPFGLLHHYLPQLRLQLLH
jgi:hypothetical protein